jgi:hypothetical protein
VAGEAAAFIMPRYVNLALEGMGKIICKSSNIILELQKLNLL